MEATFGKHRHTLSSIVPFFDNLLIGNTSAINLKLEYTFEDARRQNGTRRPDENQFGTEVAVQF